MNEETSQNQPPHQQQSIGDVTVSGSENPTAISSLGRDTNIDQRHIVIYNYYYEAKVIPAETVGEKKQLMKFEFFSHENRESLV
jgi:hypothetical protein